MQTIADGLGRETCPMLDPAKALFLGSGNHLAVAQEAGGRVAVEGVDAEDESHISANKKNQKNQHQRAFEKQDANLTTVERFCL